MCVILKHIVRLIYNFESYWCWKSDWPPPPPIFWGTNGIMNGTAFFLPCHIGSIFSDWNQINLDMTKSSFLATSLYRKVTFTKNWFTRFYHPTDDMNKACCYNWVYQCLIMSEVGSYLTWSPVEYKWASISERMKSFVWNENTTINSNKSCITQKYWISTISYPSASQPSPSLTHIIHYEEHFEAIMSPFISYDTFLL